MPLSFVNGSSPATAHLFPSLYKETWLAAGVTERTGGVSASPFSSLNLGLHVGDEADAVRENRRRAADALGFSLGQMVCGEQVHGGDVAVVTAEQAGRGATAMDTALPGVDALVTNTPGLLLTLFYADCVPVLLVDPVRRAVGVAHAGWKGVVADVAENTVVALREAFGSEPTALHVAIGPCIGPCCFEVGEEVAAHFPQQAHWPAAGAKPHVDLPAAVKARLEAAGVLSENITVSGECTSCLPERYFSHRRDKGRTGRLGALIGIRQDT
jgi:YfiH family protein